MRSYQLDVRLFSYSLSGLVCGASRHCVSNLLDVSSKKRESNTKERIELLNRFIAHFGTFKIDCLLANREFIGGEWFGYLTHHHIPFYIRIKRDRNISRTNGSLSPESNFFRSLPLSTYCTLCSPRLICGHLLWVTGMRIPDAEYVIVVSGFQSDEALEKYERRWKKPLVLSSLEAAQLRHQPQEAERQRQ